MNQLAISKYYSVPLQQQFNNIEDEFKKNSFKIKKLISNLSILDKGLTKLNSRLFDINIKFENIYSNNSKISNYFVNFNNKKYKNMIKKLNYKNKSSQIPPFEFGNNKDCNDAVSITSEKANYIDDFINLRYNITNNTNQIYANYKADNEIV